MRTSSLGLVVTFLALGSVAGASELLGEWRIAGQRDGATYTGQAEIERSGSRLSLDWSIDQGEHLGGSVAADEDSFTLLKRYGVRQRLRYFFTRRRTIAYRGALRRVSANEYRVELSAGGRVVGNETWTRAASAPAPAPAPQPQPQPQPQPTLPSPDELPFVHPDRFVPQPGTDVWQIDFNLSQFRADMRRRGLLSGDAATDQAMLLRLQSLVLQRVNELYRRGNRGEAQSGRSWKISFTAKRPQADPLVFPGVSTPRVGVDYSRMEVGGDGGGTHGRVPRNDYGNRQKEDNSGSRWGVFSGSIRGADSTLSPALTASDRGYVDGSYHLGDGDAAADRRFLRVQEVSTDWATALASTTAHEVGHSVGCPHTGKSRWGWTYRAGPRLSLMRHKKTASILSSRETRFYSGNVKRLDQSLGIER